MVKDLKVRTVKGTAKAERWEDARGGMKKGLFRETHNENERKYVYIDAICLTKSMAMRSRMQ